MASGLGPSLASSFLVAACWSAPAATPRLVAAMTGAPTCVESEGPVRITACQRGTDLEWRLENQTTGSVDAFVAPVDNECCPSLESAYVTVDKHGTALVRKFQPSPDRMDEPPYTQAYTLLPGEAISGRVHLGHYLRSLSGDLHVVNENLTERIRTVILEISWLEKEHASDTRSPWERLGLAEIARRQHFARSPVLPWR